MLVREEDNVMVNLTKPSLEDESKYKEMIEEWQSFGGDYAPCIIEYDCSNPVEELDYAAILKVVDDYSKGKVFDYDKDFVKSSDFYFIFDDDNLVGMGEIIHLYSNKPMGQIILGIRPSQRNRGYATKAAGLMVHKMKEDNLTEAIAWHYIDDKFSNGLLNRLGFQYQNSEISEYNHKEIKNYTKKLATNHNKMFW